MGWATNYINKLLDGEVVSFRPRGNSMSGFIDWPLFKESVRKILAQYGRNGITPRTYRTAPDDESVFL